MLVQRARYRVFIFSGLILTVLTGPAAAAGVYKWVDEQGRVHFGDRPQSEAAKEVRIKVDPGSSSQPTATEAERAKNRKRMLEIYQEDREAKKQAAIKQREERKRKAAECKRARNELTQYSTASGIYDDSEGGERRYLSFAERDRFIAGLRQRVNELCR